MATSLNSDLRRRLKQASQNIFRIKLLSMAAVFFTVELTKGADKIVSGHFDHDTFNRLGNVICFINTLFEYFKQLLVLYQF